MIHQYQDNTEIKKDNTEIKKDNTEINKIILK